MTARFVDIRQARTSLEVQEGQTILDAALAAGIPYPHGCRSGRCGSCKSRLIEGKVELLQHSRFALTEEEKADGLILACRALPQTNPAVAWLGSDDDDAVEVPRRLDAIVTGLDDLTHDIVKQVTFGSPGRALLPMNSDRRASTPAHVFSEAVVEGVQSVQDRDH